MTKCFAYTRVSSQKQGEGASLEAQKEAIQFYAERNNITIARWYEEKETAAKAGRPVFTKLIKELKRGRAAGLVVHKIDRSARNFRDWALIGDLADVGVEIHFATESLDFNSRGGRLAADVQAVVAADYIRNLREESLKGQRMRLQQGIYPYKAPIGYLDTGKGNLKTICPVSGPLVVELFELYSMGNHTLHTLAEYMTEKGLVSFRGGKLTKSHVEKILRNPFYTGLIHVRTTGKTYQGKHEPLISTELYAAAQAVKHKRFGKKVTKHNHLLRGLFKCGHCNGSMIPEEHRSRVYYRCHTAGCATKSIQEGMIMKAIADSLKDCRMSPEMKNHFHEAIVALGAAMTDDPMPVVADREIEKLKARENALADKLLDGVFSQELFQAKQAEISQDLVKWENRKKRSKNKATVLERAKAMMKRMDEFYFTFDMAKDERKREIIKTLYSNALVFGKNVELEPQKWVLATQNLVAVSKCADKITSSRMEEILDAILTCNDPVLSSEDY